MYTFQALQILIFLIPGFISSRLMNSLVIRKVERKELDSIVEALIFSMIIYTVYAGIRGTSPIVLDQTANNVSYLYDGVSFLWLGGITVILPILLSLFITNDWHMKIARALRISNRTAKASVWFDAFDNIRKYVVIDFENGRRLYGWPLYYSDSINEPYLFLYKPSWIIDDKLVDTEVYGMLITPEQKIDMIEFLDPQ
jgi:hypothetical protein